jgi:hypothetical protein
MTDRLLMAVVVCVVRLLTVVAEFVARLLMAVVVYGSLFNRRYP